ncbi:MAG: hypothetical protein AAFY20_05550, partial [Cyanobacteria bacterium J06639_14]
MTMVTQQRLEKESSAYSKVSIWQTGGSYALKASLPPKSGSGKWKQQWIGIGCKASKPGLKVAKAKAAKLESDLLMGQFAWDEWRRADKGEQPTSTKEWVKKFLAWKLETVNETTLYNDYEVYTRFLEVEAPLTPELLLKTCREVSPPNSRARKACVLAFSQLGKYAKLSIDWGGLAG